MQYNKRYANEKYISDVGGWICDKLVGQDRKVPSLWKRELFLRFFEELEMQRDKKKLDKECVKNLFAYYGIAAILIEDFTKGFDHWEQNWSYYIKFIQEYKDIVSSIINNNPKCKFSKDIFLQIVNTPNN